jgi:uncharacterized protein
MSSLHASPLLPIVPAGQSTYSGIHAPARWTLANTGPVETVILQPTPYCNLNCSYCYLPNRDDKRRMKVETALLAMRRVFESGRAAPSIGIRYHCGEPLAVPRSFYQETIDGIRQLTPPGHDVHHTLQTNGILLDEKWCELFRLQKVSVGLSIDGPAFLHDRQRKSRSGRPTHEKVLQAMTHLKRAEIDFHVIAVLTAESLAYPDEIYEFFAKTGAVEVAFNIEETQLLHQSPTMRQGALVPRYREFMERILILNRDHGVKIREIEHLRKAILFGGADRRNGLPVPLRVVVVDCQGNLATFAPELLGLTHPQHGRLEWGNVATDTLGDMLKSESFRHVADEVARGVDHCRESCQYFSLCGGGSPANKVGETGAFDATTTLYCTLRVQILADILIPDLEADLPTEAS